MIKKPKLIQAGRHLININDVSCISRVRSDLYIVKLLSNPNPGHPIWIEGEKEIKKLTKHFEIIQE